MPQSSDIALDTTVPPATAPASEAMPLPGEVELVVSEAAAGDAQQPMLPGLLIAGGMLLAVMVLLRSSRKRRRAADAARDAVNDTGGSRHVGVAPQTSHLEETMADASELARHLSGQLDQRAARLEILLEEADDKLRLLADVMHTQLDDRLGSEPGLGSETHPQTKREARSRPDPAHRRVLRLASEGLSDDQIATQTGLDPASVKILREVGGTR
ncbi:MAG: hypothetical protein AAF235_04720 [Planctomycetota bacterium]